MIDVIFSEETRRKTSSGSTSGSALNIQSRGRTNKRGHNFRNYGKSRENSKGCVVTFNEVLSYLSYSCA